MVVWYQKHGEAIHAQLGNSGSDGLSRSRWAPTTEGGGRHVSLVVMGDKSSVSNDSYPIILVPIVRDSHPVFSTHRVNYPIDIRNVLLNRKGGCSNWAYPDSGSNVQPIFFFESVRGPFPLETLRGRTSQPPSSPSISLASARTVTTLTVQDNEISQTFELHYDGRSDDAESTLEPSESG